MFCKKCGEKLSSTYCAKCGANTENSLPNERTNQQVHSSLHSVATTNRKSKIAAGLLALLVGLGIYNFYLDFTKKAIIQLILYIIGIAILVIGISLRISGQIGLETVPSILEFENIQDYFDATRPYTNRMDAGVYMALSSLIPFMAVGIWGFAEGIMLLCGYKKMDGKGNLLS